MPVGRIGLYVAVGYDACYRIGRPACSGPYDHRDWVRRIAPVRKLPPNDPMAAFLSPASTQLDTPLQNTAVERLAVPAQRRLAGWVSDAQVLRNHAIIRKYSVSPTALR